MKRMGEWFEIHIDAEALLFKIHTISCSIIFHLELIIPPIQKAKKTVHKRHVRGCLVRGVTV
jgi:hypothetical protein